MVGKATVLVVKVGEDDPIDRLFETLSDDDAITLESPRPVGTGVGMRLIRTKENIGVVIIIGREPAITPVVTAIRSPAPISTSSRSRSKPEPRTCRFAMPRSRS